MNPLGIFLVGFFILLPALPAEFTGSFLLFIFFSCLILFALCSKS